MTDSSRNQPAAFQSTHWSLVSMARGSDSDVRQRALEELLKTYYPALRAHLVLRMRLAPDRAEDLLQNFVIHKILQKDLVARADKTKGRLRSLLLKSLENFARTELGRDKQLQSLDDDSQAGALAATNPEADVFEVAWARSMLMEALSRMAAECQRMGRMHIWALLEARVIAPALNRPSAGYEELVEQYRFSSPQEASNALMTAKRQFKRTLRAVVTESVGNESEVDAEIAELGQILATAAPGGSSILPRVDESVTDEETGPILSAVDDSNPRALAGLLDLPDDRETLWEESDMAALVKHQLSVPLNLVFASLSGGRSRSQALLPSFGAMLTKAYASVEDLEAVKKAARAAINDESVAIPRQIAALLYFASIALALVRHNARITSSEDNVLRYGFNKMLEQQWLNKSLRQLFLEGNKRLAAD